MGHNLQRKRRDSFFFFLSFLLLPLKVVWKDTNLLSEACNNLLMVLEHDGSAEKIDFKEVPKCFSTRVHAFSSFTEVDVRRLAASINQLQLPHSYQTQTHLVPKVNTLPVFLFHETP